MEPRWTSVAVYPKGVSIETVLPPFGTVPANVTAPSAGASTFDPVGPARSTPRCWPAAYGCARSNENGRRTAPSTGHVQAEADAGRTSAQSTTTANRRNTKPPCCQICEPSKVARPCRGCQYWLQSTAVELVAGRAGQPRDDLRCLPARCAGCDELSDSRVRFGRVVMLRCGPDA